MDVCCVSMGSSRRRHIGWVRDEMRRDRGHDNTRKRRRWEQVLRTSSYCMRQWLLPEGPHCMLEVVDVLHQLRPICAVGWYGRNCRQLTYTRPRRCCSYSHAWTGDSCQARTKYLPRLTVVMAQEQLNSTRFECTPSSKCIFSPKLGIAECSNGTMPT